MCRSVAGENAPDPIWNSLSLLAIGMSSAGKEWRQYVNMARCLILWDIDGTLITTGVIGRRALEGGAAEAAGLDTVPEVSMGERPIPKSLQRSWLPREYRTDSSRDLSQKPWPRQKAFWPKGEAEWWLTDGCTLAYAMCSSDSTLLGVYASPS